MSRLAALDRDGTLVDVVRDEETGAVVTAFHPSQLRLLPGVLEGLRLLDAAGFVLAIATNQPGAAKGEVSREAIARTNAALVELLAREGLCVVEVATCLHHPVGGPLGDASLIGPCACRKPLPGLLLGLAERWQAEPSRSYYVGDGEGDVRAAKAAGFGAALVGPARCELCPHRGSALTPRPDVMAPGFLEVARAIVARADGA